MNNYISIKDIEEKCWWCGKKINGFSIELGRNVVGKYKHFCDDGCLIAFNNCKTKDE